MTSTAEPIRLDVTPLSTEPTIRLTTRALKEITKIFEEEAPGQDVGLRISVRDGGCSGLSYEMDFAARKPGDLSIDVETLKVFMDEQSSIYLKGMTIDYQGGLKGKGFTFENPNARRTCSCGESFGV